MKDLESRRFEREPFLTAALDVVRGAMSNLKVLLEDVAQTPAMDIKFNQARTRLRNKREPSVQNFTRVIEKQSKMPFSKISATIPKLNTYFLHLH